MKSIDVVDVETGEILGTVTTRYNSIEALLNNVGRWSRRHPEYSYVSSEELEKMGFKWDAGTYFVKKEA